MVATYPEGESPKADEPLLFTNPEFRPLEVNVTVRMGRKWADKGLAPGAVIELAETDGPTYGDAIWHGCLVITAEQLSIEPAPALLLLEHDPDCTTFEGIIGELCDVYGLEEIEAEQELTVCFFQPVAGMLQKNDSKAA